MIKEFTNAKYGRVRTTIIDDTPCFCLKDVCQILDIKSVSDCRGKLEESGIRIKPVQINNNVTKMLFITPKNISFCLFQSKKVEAEMICDWLYCSVLPRLTHYAERNVDAYGDPEKVVQLIDDFEDLKVRKEILETNQKMNEPKLRILDKLFGIEKCYDLETVHLILKYRGVKSMELLKILRAHHVLNEDNVPFQEYCDRRYFRIVESKTTVGNHTVTSQRTYVYQSGITFIEKILKSHEGDHHAGRNG